MDYRKIITIEPDKRGGKPCNRGLRITVYDVLEYLASGMPAQEFLADFPELTRDDTRAPRIRRRTRATTFRAAGMNCAGAVVCSAASRLIAVRVAAGSEPLECNERC